MIPSELKKAVDSLSLADIVLSSINGEVDESFAIGVDLPSFSLQTLKPHPVSFQIFDAESEESPRRIQVKVKAGARLLPKGESNSSQEQAKAAEPIASVETSFLVTYEEKVGANLAEGELALFAEHNVPFNVWPYWREVVHASFSRMGIPKVVLPLYRMKKVVPVEIESSADAASIEKAG